MSDSEYQFLEVVAGSTVLTIAWGIPIASLWLFYRTPKVRLGVVIALTIWMAVYLFPFMSEAGFIGLSCFLAFPVVILWPCHLKPELNRFFYPLASMVAIFLALQMWHEFLDIPLRDEDWARDPNHDPMDDGVGGNVFILLFGMPLGAISTVTVYLAFYLLRLVGRILIAKFKLRAA